MNKLSALLLVICFCFIPLKAYCGPLEDSFAAAQKAYKENNLDLAAQEFKKVVSILIKNKQYPQARLILGNVAVIKIKQEKYAEAVSMYQEALKLPGNIAEDFQVKAWQNMAVCHHHLNEFALKADNLEKLIKKADAKKDPNLYDLYAQLGDAYKDLEIYSKAAGAYEKASKLLPAEKTDVQNKIYTGWALCAGNLGDFATAESLLATVMNSEKIEPITKAESSSNLGILKWEQGNYGEAIKLLSQSLEIEKASMLRRNEGVDSNNYGLVLKSVGKHDKALEYFNTAINIAREQGNVRDEAIALSNIALVSRILGNFAKAKQDYLKALELYKQIGFKEGQASTLMGLGKIYEVSENNYNLALDHYRQANAIYEELQMPRGIAESLNQIGRALRKAAAPQRATRDLIFDDDEITLPAVEPAAALQESVASYSKALEIAKQLGTKELIWSAYQGLGFALNEEGKKAEALDHYEKAISLVTAMRGSKADAELLGEYIKDKKDLFTEAMEICTALFKETGKTEYMVRAMELDEILRNEIIKANAQVADLTYAEKDKQDLYSSLLSVSAQKDKANANVGMPLPSSSATPEQKQKAELQKQEAEQSRKQTKILEAKYNELLAEWKKRYPADVALFDSNSKIDTKAVQAVLTDNELVLNYISLPDNLVIVSIAKEFVRIYMEPVSAKEIDKKIKTDFLYNIMEKDGRKLTACTVNEQEAFQRVLPILHDMYNILIKPVEADVTQKERLIIVSSGFLASFPFAALASDISDPLQTEFLIEKKDIVNSRLSFFNHKQHTQTVLSDINLLAAGNPRNNSVTVLPNLNGAENEVKTISQLEGINTAQSNVKYQAEATETWLKNSLENQKYNIIYFATHGMPFSDTYALYKNYDKAKEGSKAKERFKPSIEFMRRNLNGISPLNGYLYMAVSDKDDGLLTVKELTELPDSYFSDTQLVVLSACNTGVTFVPKALENDEMVNEFNSETIQKEMIKLGWTPGVDQISFVDTFMRKGSKYSFGTLWFADDYSTSYILKSLMKNIKNSTAPTAYNETIREYLKLSKQGKLDLGDGYPTIPQHPYFWACGALFGN